MLRYLFCLLFCFFILLNSTTPSKAKRLALVIGNNSYPNLEQNDQLERAHNDARAIGQALSELNFKVTIGYDMNRGQMIDIISQFTANIENGDEVVFFYAGHGVEFDGQNYLLPTDVPGTGRKYVLKNQAIEVASGILRPFKEEGARISILFLDACRNNPFTNTKGRSIGGPRGLAAINNPGKGSMIIFSAGAGQVALDSLNTNNDTDQNSVFTRSLLPLLKQPDLKIKTLAIRVRKRTYDLALQANHTQTPASYDEILNDYYIAGRTQTGQSDQKQAKLQDMKERLAALEDKLKKQSGKKQTRVAIGVYPDKQQIPPPPFTHGYKFDDCNGADWCPKMIVVRGDTFTMGSTKTEPGREKREGPQRKVTLRKFAVGRFEITRRQFHIFKKETRRRTGNKCWLRIKGKWRQRSRRNYLNPGFSQQDDHPVICINWRDAKAYTKWLSRKTGKTYRLLTESEWEYVAGAKTTTPFWWGTSMSPERANYDARYVYGGGPKGSFRKKTVPVHWFQPNPFGLYNINGNVWEMVEDCYHKTFKHAPTYGSPWLKDNRGICIYRVIRGGSWFNSPNRLRTRQRDRAHLKYRMNTVGFRVARDL